MGAIRRNKSKFYHPQYFTAYLKSFSVNPEPSFTLQQVGHYYLLSNKEVDFDVAQKRCEKQGGHLAIDDTYKTHEAILNVLNGTQYVFIGATDRVKVEN